MKTLVDLFQSFKKRGNEDVFVYRTGIRRFTFKYSELYNSSLKMAQYLKEQGIKKGDRVALWAPNSPAWAVNYFGILLAGAIVVPIDFASGKKRAENIIKLSGSRFIIQSNYKFEKIEMLKQVQHDTKKTVMIEDLEFILKTLSPINKAVQPKASDVAEIAYTSGTTGDPKGVVLTHKNIVSNILGACEHISIPQHFNFLSVLPMSHMLEQTVGFLTPLYRGDKIIYLRTIKPSSMMDALKEENIQAMLVVPRLLSLLKNTIERELKAKHLIHFLPLLTGIVKKKFGKNFQMFITGGAGLPADIFKFWKDLGFRVVEGYGLTECSPIVTANTFEEQIAGSVGIPLKNLKIKIDSNELLVKGDSVFSSYYQNPRETEKAFKDNWFRTGDFADIDNKGNVFIKGRKKDVIVNSSGINIYPSEIENILNKIPGVKDSCVLGRDLGKGEEVHAVIILNDKDIKVQETVRLANEKLDPLSQIEGFSVWPDFDFPRTTTLKIQKFKVKEYITNEVKETDFVSSDTLVSILSAVCGKSVSQIKENSILASDLGFTSLSRLELVNALEQEYRVDLEDSIINQNTTVSDLRKLISTRGAHKKNPGLWLWVRGVVGQNIRKFFDFFIHYPLFWLFFDLKTRGLENLRNVKGPVVFISNHVSYLDQQPIIYSLPESFRYKTATAMREEFFTGKTGKLSLRKKIILIYALVLINGFLIPQKSGFRKSLSVMGKLIDRGISILIFPEGERTRDGQMLPFMQGLGLLVKELQVPVVPLKILGIENIFPRGAVFPKRGKCTVLIGKPIEFAAELPSEIVEISRKKLLSLTYK
ncbi:MAG: AMP-binding protein [bacterium]|nr:AMP-binding protein [bacterium]